MIDSNFAYMREAIELSKNGYPAPNPRVGCVIVKNSQIVGRGFHAFAGGDHAEMAALKEAGDKARNAWMFVTLEPCDHHGRTPPCTDAIISAGIERVVYAVDDPNPNAAGGANRLRAQGIVVEGGLCHDEAAEVNKVFLMHYELKRPYVLAKAAITLDGRIATRSGESRWITGKVARKRAHQLRAEMGCVLVGANTIVQDDPSLTIRDIDVNNQPLRVILDPDGITPSTAKVFNENPERTLWVSHADETRNATKLSPQLIDGELALGDLLAELAERGMIGVLVEGGGQTLEPFFRHNLVDEIELHVAPKLLGAGKSWLEGKGVDALVDAWQLHHMKIEPLGEDFKISARVCR
ncbi:MAG: bifunctional diaminohydroxyphosphoribosylaminopyrimidine deaminase/5-amino-6-(5-phosphoribosylamino)uracil reductase RibD [Fimbriimonadales bacterium]|nr:bifunctional diaminohydroxyphosphoribosylaminopyrimidine deaminase/5-amino-6-(5-phosphoribosylamino)uracil reductase RibD [Fimbriimonadales bacterium]